MALEEDYNSTLLKGSGSRSKAEAGNENAALASTNADMSFGLLEEPPFNPDDVQIGMQGLASAVAWLTGTVQEERAARRAMEGQLAEAVAQISASNIEAVIAPAPPLTPMAKPSRADGVRGSVNSAEKSNREKTQGNADQSQESSAGLDGVRNGLYELQNFVRYLEENFGNWRKQQEQKQIVADTKHARQLDEIRDYVGEELESMREGVADQVKEAVQAELEKDEPRAKLRASRSRKTLAFLPDSTDLGQRLDASVKALTERLDLIDVRVDGLTRPVLSPPHELDHDATSDFARAEPDAVHAGDSHVAKQPVEEPRAAEQSASAAASAKAASAEASSAKAPSAEASSAMADQRQRDYGDIIQKALEQVRAEMAHNMAELQSRLDSMEAECQKLAEQQESSVPEQSTTSTAVAPAPSSDKAEAVDDEEQLPSSTSKNVVRPAMKRLSRAKTESGLSLGSIRRQSTNSSDRHRSSSSDRGNITTPSNPQELRSELMRHMELQMQEFKDQTKEGTEDALATATSKMREELMGWLSTHMKSHPTLASAGAAEKTEGVASAEAAAAPASAAQAPSARAAPAAAQSASAKAASSRGRTSVTRNESAGNAGPLQAKMEDAVSAAAQQLRGEIGAWLEEQLADVRELVNSRPDTAPHSPERLPASDKAGVHGAVDSQAATAAADLPTGKVGESITEAATAAGSRRDASAQAELKAEAMEAKRHSSKDKDAAGLAELGAKTVAQAAEQIKAEIGEWLEEQLQSLRVASQSAASAPPSRGSQFSRDVTLGLPPEAAPTSIDDENRSDTSSVMPQFVNRAGGLNNLEDVVKWFESQMNDLGSSLTKSRKDAVTRASKTIRDEVKSWWEHELQEIHRSISKIKNSDERRGSTDKGAEASAARGPLMPLQESPEEWFGGRKELVASLASDEDLLNKVMDRVREELEGAAESDVAEEEASPKPDEQSDAGSQRGRVSPRATRRSIFSLGHINSLKASTAALRDLEDRIRQLEDDMAHKPKQKALGPLPDLPRPEDAKVAAAAAAAAAEPVDFMTMGEVHDALRRLSTRFEYLERLVPPDVQKALQFFEPLNSAGDGSSASDATTLTPSGATQMVGTAAIMRRIHELQAGQESVSEEAKGMSEDARREVVNLSRALRGTQRSSEVNASKLEDVQKSLAALKTRLEAALPQVLQAVEGLQRPPSGTARDVSATVPEESSHPNPTEAKEGASPASPSPVEGLRALLASGSESQTEGDTPHPFVSQSGLRRALDTMQGDVQAWLEKMREDLLAALQGKADTEILRLAIEDLTKQVQTAPVHVLAPPDDVTSPDGSAAFRWPTAQGRCLTCNTKVELRIDDPRTWKAKVNSVPTPSFPQRFPNVPPSLAPPPSMRPTSLPSTTLHGSSTMGSSQGFGSSMSSMKRVESLPAITRP